MLGTLHSNKTLGFLHRSIKMLGSRHSNKTLGSLHSNQTLGYKVTKIWPVRLGNRLEFLGVYIKHFPHCIPIHTVDISKSEEWGSKALSRERDEGWEVGAEKSGTLVIALSPP